MKATSDISFYFQPLLELSVHADYSTYQFPQVETECYPRGKTQETHYSRYSIFIFVFFFNSCVTLYFSVFKYIIHAFDPGLIVVFSGRDRAQTPWTIYNLSESSVHGILQAGIPEWVATPFSRESPQPRD